MASRALLSAAEALAAFFGRAESNNFLLPILIAILNVDDWQLRAAFFAHIAPIAAHVGYDSLADFLVPCFEPALQARLADAPIKPTLQPRKHCCALGMRLSGPCVEPVLRVCAFVVNNTPSKPNA